MASRSGGMPTPVSRTVKRRSTCSIGLSAAIAFDSHDHLAPLGELDRVADQIDQYLAKPIGVADHSIGDVRGDAAGEFQPLAMGAFGKSSDSPFDSFAKSERYRIQHQLAGLNPGEIENVIDDGQQRVCRVFDNLEILPLAGIELGVEHQLRHADNTVHRGANLVAHVGEEFAFGPAG